MATPSRGRETEYSPVVPYGRNLSRDVEDGRVARTFLVGDDRCIEI
jgi:hypothetical protein